MGRKPCCPKEGLNRGAWTAMEDDILVSYIRKHGEGRWGSLPKRAGLKRCGKSCRLRWLNYLRPGIKRGNISDDEEELIVRLHRLLGNRWSLIAGRLPGRTDNEIKNYWNTTLAKKVRGEAMISRSNSKQQHRASTAAPPILLRSRPSSEPGKPAGDAAPDEAAAVPSPPEPNTSPPVRTKAMRCTARVPLAPADNGCCPPPDGAEAVETAPAAEVQQDYCSPDGGDLSIDLDFDMGDLYFLSPWRGEAGDAVVGADDQLVVGEADLETLLLGPAGNDDVEFAWF